MGVESLDRVSRLSAYGGRVGRRSAVGCAGQRRLGRKSARGLMRVVAVEWRARVLRRSVGVSSAVQRPHRVGGAKAGARQNAADACVEADGRNEAVLPRRGCAGGRRDGGNAKVRRVRVADGANTVGSKLAVACSVRRVSSVGRVAGRRSGLAGAPGSVVAGSRADPAGDAAVGASVLSVGSAVRLRAVSCAEACRVGAIAQFAATE